MRKMAAMPVHSWTFLLNRNGLQGASTPFHGLALYFLARSDGGTILEAQAN